jgi:hypothetical protein
MGASPYCTHPSGQNGDIPDMLFKRISSIILACCLRHSRRQEIIRISAKIIYRTLVPDCAAIISKPCSNNAEHESLLFARNDGVWTAILPSGRDYHVEAILFERVTMHDTEARVCREAPVQRMRGAHQAHFIIPNWSRCSKYVPCVRGTACRFTRGNTEEAGGKETMKTLCAWCGALIKDGALSPEGQASHGICQECVRKIMNSPPMKPSVVRQDTPDLPRRPESRQNRACAPE